MTDRLDVLFVNAPSRRGVYQELSRFAAVEPPVWAGLLAQGLRASGWKVDILDAEAEDLTPMDTAFRIRKLAPRIAAFTIYGHQPSASTQCMPGASETAELLSALCMERPEKIPSVAIGTHPSALPERTLYDHFDYVCQGEGYYTLDIMLDVMKRGASLRNIPGLWSFSHGFGSVPIFGGPAPVVNDLDALLPGQAVDLLDLKRYRPHHWHAWTGKNNSYASVQTSLGCPFKCSFCCINAPFGKPGYRTWSPKNVANQFFELLDKHGVTNFKIPDEMFVLNRAHVEGVCQELLKWGIAQYLNIWAYARIDTVKDEALLALMARAGIKWLALGIESASKHVRDGVEKGRFGNEQILEAVQRVRAAGIHVAANYIFGLPDDTQASMNETLDLACEINAEYANFYSAMAYPGSPLHKLAQEKRWRLPESTLPFDGTKPPRWHHARGWIGYSQHSFDSLPLGAESLSPGEVLDFRDEAWLHYHSRPEYHAMLGQKFGQRAVTDIVNMLAFGKPQRRHRDPNHGLPPPSSFGDDHSTYDIPY